MKRPLMLCTALAVSGIVFGGAGCASVSETSSPPAASPDASAKPKPKPKPKPNVSVSKQNALRSAESYLGTAAFSRSGLIKQLTFEGYSTGDATYAVDTLHPNYNAQAAKAAKAYLDLSGFSHSGLVEQLKFEGYTDSQAEYGVSAAGL